MARVVGKHPCVVLGLLAVLLANREALAQSAGAGQPGTNDTKNNLGAGEASEKEDQALEDLSLTDLLNLKVSIASRTKDSLLESPSSVTTYSQQEIRNLGIQSVEDLLNFVPGYQTTRDISNSESYRVSVRGRGRPLSEHVLLLINGQRANDAYFGSFPTMNRFIPVENIDRVEIIRGPGSALYGSNAFLGVINVITTTTQNNIQGQYGTNYARMGAINASHTLEPFKVAGFVRAFSDDGQLFRNMVDQFNRTGNTYDPRYGGDAHLTVQVDKLTLGVRHFERNYNDFMQFGTLQNRSAYDRSTHQALLAKYEWKINEQLELDAMAGFARNEWLFTSAILPKGIPFGPGTLGEPIREGPLMRDYEVTSNVDLIWQLHTTNELLAGASYSNSAMTRRRDNKDHEPFSMEYTGDVRTYDTFNRAKARHTFGAYVQDKQKLGDVANLTAGVRFDGYNDFGTSVNPRGALVVKGPVKSHFRVAYATAFRAPTFVELGDRMSPLNFGDPNLSAEKVYTFEGGYSQWTEYFTAMVTFFHNELTNAIKLGTTVPNDPANNPFLAPAYENSKDTLKTNGLEFELFTPPVYGFNIRGAYTHLFDAGGLPMSSDFASLVLNQHVGPVNVNVNGIYRRKMDLLPNQDDYVILNTNIIADLGKRWKARASGYNLLDLQYRTISGALKDGVPNRGISALIGIMYEL